MAFIWLPCDWNVIFRLFSSYLLPSFETLFPFSWRATDFCFSLSFWAATFWAIEKERKQQYTKRLTHFHSAVLFVSLSNDALFLCLTPGRWLHSRTIYCRLTTVFFCCLLKKKRIPFLAPWLPQRRFCLLSIRQPWAGYLNRVNSLKRY